MIKTFKKIDLVGIAVNGNDGISKIREYQPELILLDIELKDYTAFEMLEKVDSSNFKIVFLTAHNEYAINAFEIEAIDYLMKPFSKARLKQAIDKALNHYNKFDLTRLEKILEHSININKKKLVIPEGNTQHFVEGDDVEYIYSQGYYVNLVMNNKKKVIRISLKAMEEILPSNFYRINKSTIVNAEKINQLIRNKTSLKIITKDRNEFFVTDKFRKEIETKFEMDLNN